MTAKFITPTVAREIAEHVAARGISINRFETIHKFADRSISKIVRGDRNCGEKLFARLSDVIDFSDKACDEVEDLVARKSISQPWPETVAKLKANPPMYARAW